MGLFSIISPPKRSNQAILWPLLQCGSIISRVIILKRSILSPFTTNSKDFWLQLIVQSFRNSSDVHKFWYTVLWTKSLSFKLRILSQVVRFLPLVISAFKQSQATQSSQPIFYTTQPSSRRFCCGFSPTKDEYGWPSLSW